MISTNKIVIWGYWAKNYGDDLFLKSLCAIVKDRCEIIIGTQEKFKAHYEQYGVKVYCSDHFLNRIMDRLMIQINKPTSYFYKVDSKCIFIMLGGSLFAENKPDYIEKQQLINLLYATKHAAKSFVIGSNFGPYKHEAFLESYRQLFADVDYITFRDRKSAHLFENEIYNINYTHDIIFDGFWNDEGCISRKIQEKYIIISVIELQHRENLKDFLEIYENTMIEISDFYLNQNYTVVLLGLCEQEGDNECCTRIKNTIQNDNCKIVNYSGDISEIASIINYSEKVFATRFHAIMTGIYFGKRIVPIIYDDKTTDALSAYAGNCTTFHINELSIDSSQSLIDCDQLIKVKTDGQRLQFKDLIDYLKQLPLNGDRVER